MPKETPEPSFTPGERGEFQPTEVSTKSTEELSSQFHHLMEKPQDQTNIDSAFEIAVLTAKAVPDLSNRMISYYERQRSEGRTFDVDDTRRIVDLALAQGDDEKVVVNVGLLSNNAIRSELLNSGSAEYSTPMAVYRRSAIRAAEEDASLGRDIIGQLSFSRKNLEHYAIKVQASERRQNRQVDVEALSRQSRLVDLELLLLSADLAVTCEDQAAVEAARNEIKDKSAAVSSLFKSGQTRRTSFPSKLPDDYQKTVDRVDSFLGEK